AFVTDIESVDLGPWLDAHGLTLAEAQAIQPAYAPECPDGSTLPVCGTDGVIYATPCAAYDEGVEVARVCAEVPCACDRDAGMRLDAGSDSVSPVSDDGCSAGGGAGIGGLPLLLLLIGRRRRSGIGEAE
ncbi:MAG: solute carrier organic anion transporter, partial [Actinobacteria bacterium]|nr:solute carrier organic anion transporter [Actinomycetota bacterium]NIW33019.1 hypothetical protein [Actinomycetota bacterium]